MFVLCANRGAYGQDAPPPPYLIERTFPDSVARVTLQDLEGTSIALAEILRANRGQKVVVYFWASWCKDCIVGLPKLSQLIEKTKGNSVSYVFVSLDKRPGKWKSAIKKFGIDGDHYRIKNGWRNALSGYVGLDWIPRYLVLDEESRVILPKAIAADDERMQGLLLD